jgi:hypothetical protein
MSGNPFEYQGKLLMIEDDECLDLFMADVLAASTRTWQYSTWKHVANMAAILTAVAAMALLSSCGEFSVPAADPPKLSLTTFGGYIELFQEEAADRGVVLNIDNLVVQFQAINQNIAGETVLAYCAAGGSPPPTINVDPTLWGTLDFIDQEILLFHESSHCLLGRAHVTDGSLSIMNPMLITSDVFVANQAALLDELFDKTKFNQFYNAVPN